MRGASFFFSRPEGNELQIFSEIPIFLRNMNLDKK